MTVNRHGCSGQSAGSQRVVIQTLQGISQTLDISLEHLEICHENETDGNRLCMLQMGKAYSNSFKLVSAVSQIVLESICVVCAHNSDILT